MVPATAIRLSPGWIMVSFAASTALSAVTTTRTHCFAPEHTSTNVVISALVLSTFSWTIRVPAIRTAFHASTTTGRHTPQVISRGPQSQP